MRAVSARCAGVVTTGAHCWRTSVLASGFSEPGAVADAPFSLGGSVSPIDWLICSALLCFAAAIVRYLQGPRFGGGLVCRVPAECAGYDGVAESLKISKEVL